MKQIFKLIWTGILMIPILCGVLYACSMPSEKVRIVEVKADSQNQSESEEGQPDVEEGESTGGEPAEGESAGEESAGGEPAEGESTEGEPAGGESSENGGTESEGGSEINPEGENENQEQETEGDSGQESGSETEQETEQETEPLPELDPMPEIPEPAKLTLVVYMAADNDLESHAIANLKAMEHANVQNMNVLVLLDRAEGFDETNGDWTDTRLFELEHDDTDGNLIVSKRLSCPILGLSNRIETELDMGNPSVLWNLLTFAKNNYESEKYALIIWGHGTGWRYSNTGSSSSRAVAVDDRTGSYMSVHDLGRAVKGKELCVIGFDTCFGGVFENVYELKNYADYTVASPGISPSGGWDYKRLLEDLSESNFFAKTIADAMADSASSDITIFNNIKLSTLMNDIEGFSKALADSIRNNTSRKNVYDRLMQIKSYTYSQYPCDLYLDIYSMAEAYKQNSDSAVAAAAGKLMKSVNSTATTPGSSKAAIGIHLIPKTGTGTTAAVHSSDYIKDADNADQCQFIKESLWWVPTKGGESGSLLDRLFYEMF